MLSATCSRVALQFAELNASERASLCVAYVHSRMNLDVVVMLRAISRRMQTRNLRKAWSYRSRIM